jgi:excisionase family DNA binding protein
MRAKDDTVHSPFVSSTNLSNLLCRRKRKVKKLLSVEDAAGLLGISKWTVRSYIRDGRLKPVRLGRRVLLAEDELERLVAEGQEPRDADAEVGELTNEARGETK